MKLNLVGNAVLNILDVNKLEVKISENGDVVWIYIDGQLRMQLQDMKIVGIFDLRQQ